MKKTFGSLIEICEKLESDEFISLDQEDYCAARYHDIGKIIIEPKLLNKKKTDLSKIQLIRRHPVVGYRILNHLLKPWILQNMS